LILRRRASLLMRGGDFLPICQIEGSRLNVARVGPTSRCWLSRLAEMRLWNSGAPANVDARRGNFWAEIRGRAL
jgi:hypothetical protein